MIYILFIILLFILSFYVTIKIKFKNYKMLYIIKSINHSNNSLFLSLGIKMGVGTLIGVSSSIIIGGFSSVIWMIIFSIITSSLIYIESYYGIKYKRKVNNNYISGMNIVIEKGLNNRKMFILSTILFLITYSFLFQMIQVNTISNMLINNNISSRMIIIMFSAFLLLTINLNIKDILNILNKIVPFMILVLVIYILKNIVCNYEVFIQSFKYYFIDTLTFKSFVSGMIIGIQRSIFTNELLVGTIALSSGCEKENKSIIYVELLSMYFVVFLIVLLMSFLIMIYLYNNQIVNDYNILLINTFYYFDKNIGVFILTVITILFGTTTILGGIYIGKQNIEYLTNKKIVKVIFNLLFITLCIFSTFVNNVILWSITDILLIIMIIINSYSIIKILRGENSDWK